ncbi:hypothetical protein SCLCIDRAFT_1212965 [Scleroderma citrinum Foug A]|uniref:Uncharacterized protein n=1 Tax=Scleroderma citrinum Foug A TaxID=1036808 RepID=A0A0C3DWB9_9AGAM|nr:hypothetical protein SCLCIDRAFT_1212965 [Scleroderma citrinum Foug A]
MPRYDIHAPVNESAEGVLIELFFSPVPGVLHWRTSESFGMRAWLQTVRRSNNGFSGMSLPDMRKGYG